MIVAASGRKCKEEGKTTKVPPGAGSRNPSHQHGAVTESDNDMKGVSPVKTTI